MRFDLAFRTDNAAFVDDPDEIAAVMRRVTRQIENGVTSGICVDTNGNTIGTWAIKRTGPR